jgi:hypothetical protein
MKISYQWILAAIIVLLIILVGAYVLTNNNNSPATNVTATPTTTITPTATVLASPSATPSTATTTTPTATAIPTLTATPTIPGSNGVKQTSFGYYITYPPFSENQVNVNPNYAASPSQGDFVYFSPIAATITKDAELEDASETPDAYAVIHRSGNLSGTTHVSIDVTSDGSVDSSSFTNTDDEDFADMTFAPGESEKTIGIYIGLNSESNVGHLTLTITDVDGVDSIGSNDMFTLTVNPQSPSPSPSTTPDGTVVQFASQGGSYNVGSISTQNYNIPIEVDRSGTDLSPLTIAITGIKGPWNYYDLSFYSGTTFDSGQLKTNLIAFSKGGAGKDPVDLEFSIGPTSQYSVGTYKTYNLTILYSS